MSLVSPSNESLDPRVESLIQGCGLTEVQKRYVRKYVEEKGGKKLSKPEVAAAAKQAIIDVASAEALA